MERWTFWPELNPSSSVEATSFRIERLFQTLNMLVVANLPFLLKILDCSLSALWYSILLVTFKISRLVDC